MNKIKNENELTPQEKWEKATLANNFLFYKIMTTNPDLCQHLLEILLEKKIDSIKFVEGEDTLDVDWNSKGIRLDVYVKSEDTVYDIEMQLTNKGNLPERARYYQSVMDVDCLGQGKDYRELPNGYVLFICFDDIFGKGLPVYTFQNTCKENPEIKMNDRTIKLFFNASKYVKMENREMQSFFKFLKSGEAVSDFEKKLNEKIVYSKHNTRWRQQFMTWEQEMKDQYRCGVEDGIQQGLEQGARQKTFDAAKKFLSENVSPEIIAKCVGLSLDEILELKNSPNITPDVDNNL